jgi:hypothetical protein
MILCLYLDESYNYQDCYKSSLLFKAIIFNPFGVDVSVVIVVLQQYLSKREQVKSRPEVFLDINQSIVGLHQHVVAQPTLS